MAEFDSVIPAGGSGKLTAKMKTAATQQGSLSKSISVNTDAVGAERLTLSMTLRAVPAVSVLPQPRVFLTGLQGERPSAILVLRRQDGEPLAVTGVEAPDPRLQVTVEKVGEGAVRDGREVVPGDVVLVATLAPDVAPATASGRVRVSTDHPAAAVVDIPFTFRVRPIIEARPEQLRLVLEDGNSAARATVFRLQHNRQTSFRITGLAPSAPELFLAQQVGEDDRRPVHSIAVRLVDGLELDAVVGRRMERLELATDDPLQPLISVPVMVEARRSAAPRPPRPLP